MIIAGGKRSATPGSVPPMYSPGTGDRTKQNADARTERRHRNNKQFNINNLSVCTCVHPWFIKKQTGVFLTDPGLFLERRMPSRGEHPSIKCYRTTSSDDRSRRLPSSEQSTDRHRPPVRPGVLSSWRCRLSGPLPGSRLWRLPNGGPDCPPRCCS